MYSETVKSY
uniref:Uncharacterized protein n=1 Tax=Arundo donax TaxID=35708 RepID=A0A0A9FP03_ARUDO